MNICLSRLWLEATRRCDLKCRHCLKGDCQNVDMTPNILEKALNGITAVDEIRISGGETSLNIPLLYVLKDILIRKKIEVGFVSIATNANRFRPDLVDAYWELTKVCKNPHNCIFAVSGDQFHETDGEAIEEYRKMSYLNANIIRRIPPQCIINGGRAKTNGIGVESFIPNLFITPQRFKVPGTRSKSLISVTGGVLINRMEKDFNNLKIQDDVYVSANGNITFDNRLSFEYADMLAAGNVMRKTYDEILAGSIHPKAQITEIGVIAV